MNCPLHCKGFFWGSFLICLLLAGSTCKEAPLKPVNIKPNDVCFYCKAPIAKVNLGFAAEFIAKDGFARKFDDLGCLISNAKIVGIKNIRAVYAMDLTSKTLFPAEQLNFIRSEKIHTPQKSGIVAVRDKALARQMASQYQTKVLKLDDILR